MKIDSEELKRIINKSAHLSDLEKLLADKKIEFKTPKKLSNFLHYGWVVANKDLIKQVEKEPLISPCELPYTKVNHEEVTYKLHGIVHGEPTVQPSKKVRDFIIGYTKNRSNPPKVDYFLEKGFADFFGLDSSKEMSENFSEEHTNRTGKLDAKYGGLLLPLFPLITYFVKKSKSSELNTARYMVRALDDIRYLSKCRKMYEFEKLPEPLNLELKQKIDSGKNFSVLRSLEMAVNLVLFAKIKKLKTVHAIIGLDHESEISYFLSEAKLINFEYDKDKDEYSVKLRMDAALKPWMPDM